MKKANLYYDLPFADPRLVPIPYIQKGDTYEIKRSAANVGGMALAAESAFEKLVILK